MAARIFREGVASRNGVLALTVRISIPRLTTKWSRRARRFLRSCAEARGSFGTLDRWARRSRNTMIKAKLKDAAALPREVAVAMADAVHLADCSPTIEVTGSA